MTLENSQADAAATATTDTAAKEKQPLCETCRTGLVRFGPRATRRRKKACDDVNTQRAEVLSQHVTLHLQSQPGDRLSQSHASASERHELGRVSVT